MLNYSLLFTFLASALSLLLVAALLLHRNLVHKISFSLVAFAAGALLATGFIDILKEAVSSGGEDVFIWVVLAIGGFFLIERLFISFHHHDDEAVNKEDRLRLPASFLVFGDGLHNFIDGASIAASFLVSFPLGLITSIAVFIHEIPHELGDFGILIHKGWSKRRVLLFNALTGMASLFGVVVAFYIGSLFENIVPVLLAITAGNFIYLSATDLLPEIHHKAKKDLALNHTLFFFMGIFLIIILIKILD